MSGGLRLRFVVQDVEQRRLTHARVEISRPDGGGRIALRYDEERLAFAGEVADRGDWLLRVSADGFQDETIPLPVGAGGAAAVVTLPRPGDRFYVIGGRRMYYSAPRDATAALIRDEVGRAGTRRIVALPPKAATRLLDAIDGGPVIDDGPSLRFLSREIDVVVGEGVTREELEKALRPFELGIVSPVRSGARRFRVAPFGLPSADHGALPERLMQLPIVRSASSIVVARSEPTGVVAKDVLAPLQFALPLLRVPDAWELVDPSKGPASLGSADVIVAVFDWGIETDPATAKATHPAFSGSVVGGALTAKLGSAEKLVFAFDFNHIPIGPGNQLQPMAAAHGSGVAGIVSAAADAEGVVGIAANTRLASYVEPDSDSTPPMLAYVAGLHPLWARDHLAWPPDAQFPFLLGSGGNPVPSAAIANMSFTYPLLMTPEQAQTLQRITFFGRERRGMLLFAAAGNGDKSARAEGRWAADTNVIRVAASTLDVREEEVRANYSSFSNEADAILDFCAPSGGDSLLPEVHDPPRRYRLSSAQRSAATGELRGGEGARTGLADAPTAGAAQVKVAPADLASFPQNETVVIRDRTNPLHAELRNISSQSAPATLHLDRPLRFSYAPGAGEIVRLLDPKVYTSTFNGTSGATPEASAIAALMLSVRPSLSWLEVRELMRATAVPIGLRVRGSVRGAGAPSLADARYRWVDPSGAPLLDLSGALLIDGAAPDRTISSANGPLARGTRILKLNDASGIAPRQALVIGAETKLTGAHPQAPANVLHVERSDGFEPGDTIFIGQDVRTVLLRDGTPGDTTLWVQSADGIAPGEEIRLDNEVLVVQMTRRLGASSLLEKTDYFGDAWTGLVVAAIFAPHDAGTIVTLGPASFEGPFQVQAKGPAQLTLDKNVAGSHPGGRLVWKQGTELRAVIRLLPGNSVEIDPLGREHPYNAAGVEHVRVGRIADYSHSFGRGRLDAFEAVKAAKSYTHDERDLMIRGFAGDDGTPDGGGKQKKNAKEIESPDLWVRNDAASPASTGYDETPHQTPEIPVDPAIHIGTGRNDLEVGGTCTTPAELTFEVEIEDAVDHFRWSRNGAPPTTAVAITGALQDLSDGVKIRFASTSGHVVGDRWIVRARQVEERHVHARVLNRGKLPFFTKSPSKASELPAAMDVAQCRILLCVSDGYPVARNVSVSFEPGPHDLEVIAPYSGNADRPVLSIDITEVDPSGDTFLWYRDGTLQGTVKLTAGAEHDLDGFHVRFGSHVGHHDGQGWTLFARSTDAFLNVDHYWDEPAVMDQAPPPREVVDLATGKAGTVILPAGGIDGLGAGQSMIHHAVWPEGIRPARNNPNAPRPLPQRPRRFFLLAETVPHDGALMGVTPKTNNNLAFREIAFAKFRFAQANGSAALEEQIDVAELGASTTKAFRVEVRTTCGTFRTEKVRLRFTVKAQAKTSTHLFRFDAGQWSWDQKPVCATAAAPMEALRPDGSSVAATGEQFDLSFACSLTVDYSFSEVAVAAEIVSDFRELVVATAVHTFAIAPAPPLPLGTGAALAATLPRPRSFVFADTAGITQTASQAFGPVDADPANRYRVTSLFTAPADVKAYAAVRGLVALQRNPANGSTINLIVRPLDQPIPGFAAIRYFVYRGIRLTDYLNGPNDEKIASSPQFPFLAAVRATFLKQNNGVTDMPAAVFGYDPATQQATDSLDALFFREGPMQLPVVQSGEQLGWFDHAGFGFEIVAEEGEAVRTLAWARKASYEVDVTSLAAGSFARRLAQEEILGFLDPAAFYGLHVAKGGVVRAPGNAKWEGNDVYTNVVDRFFSKQRLYLDVRSENGSSFDFHGNYGAIQWGLDPAAATSQPYATSGWPIVFLDQNAWGAAVGDFNVLHLRLPLANNVEPVLYAAHGQILTGATDGSFVRGEQLVTQGQPSTNAVGFLVPTTTGAFKNGVAWILRLFYGRLFPATQTVPIPASVLKTAKYTDNVFGPIDRAPSWSGQAPLRWTTTQNERYVDGPGWRQMMQCGLALDTGTQRVLLHATATARDFVVDPAQPIEFAPLRGMPAGVSRKASFFAEPGLFGVYDLVFDQTHDGNATVRTLQLAQSPARGYAPTSALLLGLTKPEFDSLVALAPALDKDYLRTLALSDETPIADPDRPATRYAVGVQGLTSAAGTFDGASSSVQVYSVDGLFFASKAFADAEPLPIEYARNYEEGLGARDWPQQERKIASVDQKDITIKNADWRDEVHVGTKLHLLKAGVVDQTFTALFVAKNGDDTIITLDAAPPAAAASAKAITFVQKVEDRMIDLDQADPILGLPTMRTLVDAFVNAVEAIPNDASAKNAIAAKIDDQGGKILDRARALAKNDRPHAETAERALYWARLRMSVALKSHPLCLASIAARNELVARLERKSRGYDVSFAAVDRKILLLGFDPFDLHLDLAHSNPSGAVALALHDALVSAPGKSATVSSVILPVRYRDFDADVVEDFVNPLLTAQGAVSMILGLSEHAFPRYDLLRIAGRRRSGYYDNDRMTAAPRSLGDDATHDDFYESTLPAALLVPGGPFLTPPDAAQKLFFDQAFVAEGGKSFAHAADPDAAAGANANQPAYTLASITGRGLEGSGGDDLANELFYRIARSREALPGSTKPPTGHLALPDPRALSVGIAAVIAEVEKLLQRWLAGA